MARLRHPINGAMYTVLEDGLVEVENNGLTGIFDADGLSRLIDGRAGRVQGVQSVAAQVNQPHAIVIRSNVGRSETDVS